MDTLLEHVLEDNCQDPDCEIHHPEVGLEERVVGATELAYYLAGALWMARNFDCIHPKAPFNKLKDRFPGVPLRYGGELA